MSPINKTMNPPRIYVSPAVLLLLAAFVWLTSAALLAALLLAALCHELGHYAVLHHLGARVTEVRITLLGANMRVSGRRLSYGEEMLAVAAGPCVNLLLAVAVAAVGGQYGILCLLAGAQLVLGLFNLIPLRPLDGGNLLWLAWARVTDPFAADRACQAADSACLMLLIAGALVVLRFGGSPFLLLSAVGLALYAARQKGLVKRPHRGYNIKI